MVRARSEHGFRLSRAAEALRVWWHGRWGRATVYSAEFVVLWFLVDSAMVAWSGGTFDLYGTLVYSLFMGLGMGFGMAAHDAGIITFKLRRNGYGLLRRKAALRRRWRKTMGEVEQLRLTSLDKR